SAVVGGSVAPRARPGTVRSTGPSPATVTTSKPRVCRARAHASATMETPSVRPSRNERMAQVGTAAGRSGEGSDGGWSAGGPGTVAPDDLAASCRSVLGAHWREPGFTVPNDETYPWQWLWDSAFHAVVWAHLGEPERALSELRCLFARQHESGFV